MLTKTQWLVLNSTADDFEDLEQIYRSINLEYCPQEHTQPLGTCYWRDAPDRIRLAEIVDCIRDLVMQGLLKVRMTEGSAQPEDLQDHTYLWHGWFQLTAQGRTLLESTATQWS